MSPSPISTDYNPPNHEERMFQVPIIHYPRNIFYTESIEAAKNFIRSKIATSTEGFYIQIHSVFYFSSRFQEFLDLAQEENIILRYNYFLDDSRLQIVPMGCPVHEAFFSAFGFTLAEYFMSGSASIGCFIKQIRLTGTSPEQIAGCSTSLTTPKKAPARSKRPNLGLSYVTGRGDDKRATVIFEIGFSESYDDLVNDAYQWLTTHKSDVNLVIIIDIKEDRSALQADQCKERIRQLAVNFGNEKGRMRHNIEGPDSDDMGDNDHSDNTLPDATTDVVMQEVENDDQSMSDTGTEDLFDDLEKTMNVNDWVGPLTASLEFWELKDGKPHRRGKSFVS